MASIEEKVEEHYKKILDELGIRHYGKTESINRTITDALRSADSKSGGSGNITPIFSFFWKIRPPVEFLL